jgi:hypothetical protein
MTLPRPINPRERHLVVSGTASPRWEGGTRGGGIYEVAVARINLPLLGYLQRMAGDKCARVDPEPVTPKVTSNQVRAVPAEPAPAESLHARESLDRLWTYTYPAAARRYLDAWIDQLKWQRLKPFQDLALMLLRHQEGLLNYCRTQVLFGVVEAVNGNIKSLIRRGRGYRNLRYLLLKAQRLGALKLEVVVLRRGA